MDGLYRPFRAGCVGYLCDYPKAGGDIPNSPIVLLWSAGVLAGFCIIENDSRRRSVILSIIGYAGGFKHMAETR